MPTTVASENVALQSGFSQVCVWPATVVGGKKKQAEFVKWIESNFDGVRVQYLEEIKTLRDDTGPGGRNDLLFAVHQDDVAKFAIPRLQYGIRWIEDVYGNKQGHLYDARIAEYKSWDAGSVDSEDDCQDEDEDEDE